MIEILNGIRETIIYDHNMSLRLHQNVQHENYPIHWQPAIEIIMPLDNIYTVQIDDRRIILQPGELLFIAPGVLHQIFAPETGQRYILLFDPPLFSNILGLKDLHSIFDPYALFSKQTAPQILEQMAEQMHKIYQEYYNSDDDLMYASVYAAILQLLATAGRNNTRQTLGISHLKNSTPHKYVNKFVDICNYINEHCTEKLDVQQLAALSGFSESHFIRLFKQFTSISYYEYINQRRVSYAKNLLHTQPSLTIVEISMQAGFGSLPTFNRLFKSVTKCTPRQYRELQSI